MQDETVTFKKAENRRIITNVKLTQLELDWIDMLSKRYAGGNRSEWMRQAALRFRPTADDLLPLDLTDAGSSRPETPKQSAKRSHPNQPKRVARR